jgi:hypothetical protein
VPPALLPAPAPLPEEAALRAGLVRVAQPLTALRVWAFGGTEPAADAPPLVPRSALGIFLHAGVAVTVTPLAAGRLGRPLPPCVRLPSVADRPNGELV